MSDATVPDQALSSLRVLDLTHYVAGPYCTKLLADFGADVLKIERPGVGDGARRIGPFQGDEPHPEKSGLFLYLNTNKKSITLNMSDPDARKLALRLTAISDVDELANCNSCLLHGKTGEQENRASFCSFNGCASSKHYI